jgi:outer membrane protein assembly factor BamB
MLHVCSPIDRAPLWTWQLPPRFSTPTPYGWVEEQLANQPMRSLGTAVNEFQTNVGNLREGALMSIAGESLVLLGQRELVVFDVRTGEELWRREGMAASAALVADHETVCVSATLSGSPAAFRLRDGRELEAGMLPAVIKRTFAIEGDAVLTRQALPGLLSNQVRIVAERPSSGEVVWSQAVSSEVLIHILPERELVGVEPGGQAFIINLETGERSELGRVPLPTGGPRRAMHVVADADRVYVAVHHSQVYDFTHVSIPSISISGELHAFDRKERRLAWTERVPNASLLTARLSDLPVVILVEHGVPPRRRMAADSLSLPELKLVALDKRSGTRVAEWAGVTQHGSPAAMTVDPVRQRIDLFLNHYSQNFSDRLRIQFGSPRPTTVP